MIIGNLRLILIWISFEFDVECCRSNPSIDELMKSNANDLNQKDVPQWEVYDGRWRFTATCYGGRERMIVREKREHVVFIIFIKQMLMY